MQVSIILINYNTYRLSKNAIQSIYDKTKKVDYEIILVDNASTECPPEHFQEEFPEIRLIKSPENLGFAKGNNLGIAKAKGKYILLLNSDAELKNNAIELAIERMEQNKTIGVLSSKLLYPSGHLQHPAERFDSISKELRELFRINKLLNEEKRARYYLGDAFNHQLETECDWVWGTFFMFRSEILDQLPDKKLADHFFMYGEDVQWCYQIGKLGYKIFYYPKAEVIHHLGGSDKSEDDINRKFYDRLLPNLYKVLQMEKGKLYAFFTYFVKAIHFLTLRTTDNITKAKYYFRLIFSCKSIR